MIYKLLVKEQSFVVAANIDEYIKTQKNKLIVKQSTKFTLRPKPGGLIINPSKSNVVLKHDQGLRVSLKKTDQTAVYKQII